MPRVADDSRLMQLLFGVSVLARRSVMAVASQEFVKNKDDVMAMMLRRR